MTSTLGRSTHPTDRSYLSIREVLELLIGDFPDVTISKIRFLEARGLIHPERTPSGYRKFYKEDVDRLRWILRQQRENYLPLNVIKVRLDGGEIPCDDDVSTPSLFDGLPLADNTPPPAARDEVTALRRGHPAEGPVVTRHLGLHTAPDVAPSTNGASAKSALPTVHLAPTPERTLATVVEPPVVSRPAEVAPRAEAPAATTPARKTASRPTTPSQRGARSKTEGYSGIELAQAVGAAVEFISEIDSYGLISGKDLAGVRCYSEDALEIARIAHTFAGFGIEPRHLKSLQHAAIRESELFSQVVVPLLRQRNPEARTQAETQLSDLVDLGTAFKSAFVQMELRNLTGG